MSAARKLQRDQRSKQEAEQLRMAAKAATVASLVFDGDAPTKAALKIRIAIGLNFVLLCRAKKMNDLGRALRMVRSGFFEYDEKRDGPSQFMRWWKQVLEQRAMEDAWHAERANKAAIDAKLEAK